MTKDNKEIERKFLLKYFPAHLKAAKEPSIGLKQGYLKTGIDYEVRISNRLHLTVKQGFGLVRKETIEEISQKSFDLLWPLTEGKRIEKDRHYYQVGNHLAEIDIYSGGNKGIEVVEVEFANEEEANSFIPPDWFGQDVTLTKSYKNSLLAL